MPAPTPPPSHPTTLFIRNLSPQTTKPDLISHFSGIGPLRRVILVTDSTGLCKGISFIHYALASHAQTALQTLNGSLLRRRRIHVELAQPRTRNVADADGGLLPKHKPARENVKKKGALKGSEAMRTVLIRKEGVTEMEARELVGEGLESVVLAWGIARCRFKSWSEAGRAAARAHGGGVDACVEALEGGKRTRVIVRNLPFKVGMGEVRRAFEVKPIREVCLAPSRRKKDREGGKGERKDGDEGEEDGKNGEGKDGENGGKEDVVECGGFGFVEYFLVSDAKYAVQKLNGTKIGGRVVAVDMAIDRSDYVKRVEEMEKEEERNEGDESAEDEENNEEDDDANDNAHEANDDGEDDDDDDDNDGDDEEDDDKGEEISKAGEATSPAAKSPKKVDAKKKEAKSTPEEMERTVFVRNLLYETSAPELWKAMENEFGRVEQAVLVMHPISKRPRGTAFVRFASKEDAEKAVARGAAGDTSKTRSAVAPADGSGFMLQGRMLMIAKAVDRSKAIDFVDKKSKKEDRRNLRLAEIGQIVPGTPEARGVSEEDLARYARWAKEKKVKLEKNPNAFVSDVRLSVRNLPRELEDKTLKQLFLIAAKEEGKGEVQISHCKIVRDAERKDRSKGYGFVQFERHEDAMRALRRLSHNPKVVELVIKAGGGKMDDHRKRLLRKQWRDRRLQVEFAVEDRRAVRIIEGIKQKGRKMAEENRLKKEKEGEEGVLKGKRKRGKGAEEDVGESARKKSRSEKKSTLKRKRAQQAEAKGKETEGEEKRSGAAGIEHNNNKRPAKANKETVAQSGNGPSPKRTHHILEASEQTDAPPAKPKKPRRKRCEAEKQHEEKLDTLVAAYKRKLEKASQSKSTTGTQLQASAITRWFE